ncbi:GntR family transcriptional regulator [Cellulomonas phragmiteti]|uniref:GntR family transcriptional regulator n=1 Tax=Cellulomonas phragmiteti TaxID=478780 RepID=A0ABQ4DK99_9CELL|nr:GntR family transcriptional regulator [Cellulomonas phragmiteti]GIG39764.1 GntR family transcriptional regulator [Cellulomonas phragmiteti]
MSLRVHVDLTSSTPHYEQIRAQVAALVVAGRLVDGERLPTVRALANDLGIAAGTVARAYRELEASGLATTRRRLGTVVTAPAVGGGRQDVAEAAVRLVDVARAAGVSDEEVQDLVASALLTLPRRPATTSPTPAR